MSIDKGALLNDDGYRALQSGLVDEALELFRLSTLVCCRTGDIEGEVLARENHYLALRTARRYPEAAQAIIALLDPMLRGGFLVDAYHYSVEILEAGSTLTELADPFIVRDTAQDEDLRRGVAELGGVEALEQRGILLVSPDQDVLEVLGHLAKAERRQLVERVAHALRAHITMLGPPSGDRARAAENADDLA